MTPPRVFLVVATAALLAGGVVGAGAVRATPDGDAAAAAGGYAATAPGGGNAAADARTTVADTWPARIRAAGDFAEGRRGRVAFALVDERGRLRVGPRARDRFHSASLVKAMLLVAYLDAPAVRGRDLRDGERALLGEMIRRSGNRTATRVRNTVGNAGLRRVARRARMRDFATAPSWGSSLVSAADQARFFFRVDRLVPRRHRGFTRELLAGIVRSQRWGIAQAVPDGWTAYFKGAWRPEAGARLVHQAALLRRGGTRMALAVLTDGQPWHGYGTLTVRGIARRLLRDGPPAG